MDYQILKALHIILVVTWFAGLFFIVRVFVYHTEALQQKPEGWQALDNHFKRSAKPLWYAINWPSALGAWWFGVWMLLEKFGWNWPSWMVVKLVLVVLLTIYHAICHYLFIQLQNSQTVWTGLQLRLWNEVATIILVAVVFLVELQQAQVWWKSLVGLLLFIAIIMGAVAVVKRIRK
jgi:protoporphyrinogen IX oxidase